jgi:hypothetical protein
MTQFVDACWLSFSIKLNGKFIQIDWLFHPERGDIVGSAWV